MIFRAHLRPDETVLLVARRHWFAILGNALIFFILFLVPIFCLVLPNIIPIDTVLRALQGFGEGGKANFGAMFLFVASGWWLLLWMAFFVMWTNYYLDMWIVTGERVVRIEQQGLFHRQISECRLDRVQDITVAVEGIIPTLMHFGTIEIQTAAEEEWFTLRQVPYPQEIKDAIMRAQQSAVTKSK